MSTIKTDVSPNEMREAAAEKLRLIFNRHGWARIGSCDLDQNGKFNINIRFMGYKPEADNAAEAVKFDLEEMSIKIEDFAFKNTKVDKENSSLYDCNLSFQTTQSPEEILTLIGQNRLKSHDKELHNKTLEHESKVLQEKFHFSGLGIDLRNDGEKYREYLGKLKQQGKEAEI